VLIQESELTKAEVYSVDNQMHKEIICKEDLKRILKISKTPWN